MMVDVTLATFPQMTIEGLSRKQQRELGLLPRQCVGYVLDMKRDGLDLDSLAADELAAMILTSAMEAHPEAWTSPAAIDWDAIGEFLLKVAEFLKQITPLILQIIAVFL